MTPDSSARMVGRIDTRNDLKPFAQTITQDSMAPIGPDATAVGPSQGLVVKPVSAVTGPGAPSVSPEQQIQDNKDRLAEWNQMHPNGRTQLPQDSTQPNQGVTQPNSPQPDTNPAPTAPTTTGPATTAPTTTAPTTEAPTTTAPTTAAPVNDTLGQSTDPLIQQMLGTTGPIQQPTTEVGSLPWLLTEVNKPKPDTTTSAGGPSTTVTAEATVTTAPTAPTQAELDASRVERILPEGIATPERMGKPAEWTDGNGTQGSLYIDEFGYRHWRFLQSNGRLIEVTEGGGSDGGDRPWTHTTITEPDQTAPRVDTYDTTGVTAYVDTTGDVETRLLRFQGGDIGIEEHHGGSDGQDRPWSQTVQFSETNQFTTTRTQDGISWTGPVIDNKIHVRSVGNNGTESEETIPLSPWEPGFGYVTTPDGIRKRFTTHDGVVTGGMYTDKDGTDLGTFQLVDGATTFFASKEFINRRFPDLRITSLRVVIGADGKATTFYQVANAPEVMSHETKAGELPEWNRSGELFQFPGLLESMAKGIGHSWNVLSDVVGEYAVGPIISLGHPIATSKGVTFVPYQPPPEKRHTPGEVIWAAVDIVSLATLFVPLPLAPIFTRLAATGRAALAGAETVGRAALTGAEIIGRPVLAAVASASRAALTGAGTLGRSALTGVANIARASTEWLPNAIGAGLPRLPHFSELTGAIKAAASTIKDQSSIIGNVSSRIADAERFSFSYSRAETARVIWNGKRLGLDNKTIEDLIRIASREAKPITSRQLIEQMNNWVNVVQPRGYPYRFTSLAEYEGFKTALLGNTQRAGLSTENIFVQGSSLRTPAARDIDIAIFVSEQKFDSMLIGNFQGKVALKPTATTPRTPIQLEELSHSELVELAQHIKSNPSMYNADAKTFMLATLKGLFNSKTKGFNSLRDAAKAMQQSHPDLNIETLSVALRHGEFDTLPALRIQ
ncbi:hypothetical protein [Nocardia sp. NPDC052566]|uniref:hypothetical protein n=1 Tax=Nocardia sp. NPDC052566 TaxID=3364330 RepID=UPI0037C6C1F4